MLNNLTMLVLYTEGCDAREQVGWRIILSPVRVRGEGALIPIPGAIGYVNMYVCLLGVGIDLS